MAAGPAAILDAPGTRLRKRPSADLSRVLTCGRCDRLLPATAFYADRTRGTGRSSRCRSCTRTYLRSWDATHRDQYARQHEAAKRARFARDPVAAAKQAARVAWRAAWNSGALPKKGRTCAGCLRRFHRREIEGHHPDPLAAPLVAVQVCGPCHRLAHRTTTDSTFTVVTWGSGSSTSSPGGAK